MEDEGWVYCISNPSFIQNIYKIGKTNADDVEERVDALYTTPVPYPFKIEFAAKFENCTRAERNIHNLMGHFNTRINEKREFFESSIGDIIIIFESQNPIGEIVFDFSKDKSSKPKIARDNGIFDHKQRIRHVKDGDVLMGYWDKNKFRFCLEDDPDDNFQALTGFENHHLNLLGIETRGANGWRTCEVENSDGSWVKAGLYKDKPS